MMAAKEKSSLHLLLDCELLSKGKYPIKVIHITSNRQGEKNIKYQGLSFDILKKFKKENPDLDISTGHHLMPSFYKNYEEGLHYEEKEKNQWFRPYYGILNAELKCFAMAGQAIYVRYKNKVTRRLTLEKVTLLKSHPRLRLVAVKRPKYGFELQIFVITNKNSECCLGTDCHMHGHLVLTAHSWQLLSNRDAIVIDRITDIDQGLYRKDEESFIKHVVLPAERSHKVEFGEGFSIESIHVEPQKSVIIQEISNQFLMITPRFNYDGFVIDGKFSEVSKIRKQGKRYEIHRDRDVESEFQDFIQSSHPNFSKQFNQSYNLTFKEASKKNWFLHFYHELLQQDCEIVGMDMLRYFRFSEHPVITSIELKDTKGSLFTFQHVTKFGDEIAPLKALQTAVRGGSAHVFLLNNTMGVLTDEWYAEYAALLEHCIIVDESTVQVSKWYLLSDQSVQRQIPKIKEVNEEWWELWLAWQNEDSITFSPPKTLDAQLRPYQHKGYEWMVLLSKINAGGCLSDEMGLGKTLQTIAFIVYISEQNPSSRFLIVCPTSLLFNWKNEFEKFAPSLKLHLHHGPQRNFDDFLDSDAQVCIVGYATLLRDTDFISAVKWSTVVLDESHYIKNKNALTTKAVMSLYAENRIALSGTPILNNTFDLYSQFDFLVPGLLGSQSFFRKTYAHPIDRNQNKRQLDKLNRLTAPFILHRTKSQVARDLPPKTETILWCEMADDQMNAYREVQSQVRDNIFTDIKNQGLQQSKLSVLKGITRLKQMCCSPSLNPDISNSNLSSVKVSALLSELENNLGKSKVLVFSQFNQFLNIISSHLDDRSYCYFHLSGQTKAEDRAKMIEEFQDPNDPTSVFLLSLKAGNTGLNLTEAEYVFLMDPWWNRGVENQAIDRAHRIGQDKHVFAYRMICRGTIEEKIVKLQERKQWLSDELLTIEEGFTKQLTTDDIDFLFNAE